MVGVLPSMAGVMLRVVEGAPTHLNTWPGPDHATCLCLRDLGCCCLFSAAEELAKPPVRAGQTFPPRPLQCLVRARMGFDAALDHLPRFLPRSCAVALPARCSSALLAKWLLTQR